MIEVQNLTRRYGERLAVDGVSFRVEAGELLALVGASGSGKTTTLKMINRLVSPSAGRVLVEGEDTATLEAHRLRRRIGYVFQGVGLFPHMSVGENVAVPLRLARWEKERSRERVTELLALVELDPQLAHRTPSELSGGQQQRVCIAMALACDPDLVVLDEPTTGLDVTTQAAIMDLIDDLAQAKQMATLLITHDLGMAAEHCERIVVMHAGHVVECAPTAELFANPRHPYTGKLIAATPRPGVSLDELAAIPGGLPDLRGELPACRYSRRCERYAPFCDEPLPIQEPAHGHTVACWKPL
jgi:peptide/nickel transport system ATP-binding protein